MEKIAVQINCNYFKYNNEENLLEDFFMEINYGEITLLSGLSGCGKSSLLYLINGIVPRVINADFNGEVLIDGENVSDKSMSQISRKVGSVLQNAESQIIHQIVEDEIAFGCENFGFEKNVIDQEIEKGCSIMELERNWKCRDLSGGQKQRLLTASALAMKGKIFIFDEPLANLDLKGAEILMNLLKKLAGEGKAVLLVEHRLDLVLPFADKVWIIENKKVLPVKNKVQYLKSQTNVIENKKENNITQNDPAFKIENLTKSFGQRKVLAGITFDVYKGERILLTGENGSGKSTLLSIIARLQKGDSGRVLQFLDKNLSARADKKWFKTCGMVYQNPNYQLFMPTVKDEILFACNDYDYAMDIAERLNLISLMNLHPQSLSEGQKRRVTIGAILAQRPKVLFLDEPTVGQDYSNLKNLVEVINDIHRRENNTMITITHDIRCSDAFCDRKLCLHKGKLN